MSTVGASVRATTKVADPSTEPSELQLRRVDMELEICRMELKERERERQYQLEERERQREREREESEREESERGRERDRQRKEREERERERDRQHQLELRPLELKAGLTEAEPAQNCPRPFRVDTAIKLIPKFNEHDIESFLISFEKIAELNAFPKDKYAHLTGKALKVFTELSVQQCQEYKALKEALLTAYSVVPEIYRKRFRGMTTNRHETFSEFAFGWQRSLKDGWKVKKLTIRSSDYGNFS